MAKSDTERIKKIDEKLLQLKAQKQSIINREKEKARRARTRRLIQNGALAEKYLSADDMEPEEFEKLLAALVAAPQVQKIIKQI